MASGSGEQPLNSPTAADGRARADRQLLKDLHNKEDDTTMAAAKPMNPLLLASACFGSCPALTFLFSREDKQEPPTMMPTKAFLDMLKQGDTITSLATQEASDVEEGVDHTAMPAAPLLEGVTVEGDTALHAVATHGDGANYLSSADVIYSRAKPLLFKPNKNGDTPLHCAARAGNSQMVSSLIALAKAEDNSGERLKELLRKENGRKETALHEAVRIGNNGIVKLLMTNYSELARFPKQGTSPLYLAILLEKDDDITQSLHDMAEGNLSYSGPNGQNALHAAVLRKEVFTEKLLGWNKGLTAERDENGSTPLHFAAALLQPGWVLLAALLHRLYPGRVLSQVFEANPAALYQSDHDGLFPIHVAASVGATATVAMFLKEYPSSAGLRDAKRRTFLHIAVRKKKRDIVQFACRTTSLAWILNMQDIDGNTALHLAVKAGSLRMFCSLFGNRKVHLNLTNDKGQTPLDISQYIIPPGVTYNQSPEVKIHQALQLAGARHGGCRRDHLVEKYKAIHQLKSDYQSKELERLKDKTQTDYESREREKLKDTTQTDYGIRELEKLKDSTQTLCIGSVLIATVTFGATFALPGGYRADDHANGGTPTLAGRYAFDAFMMANTLAFICSAIATLGLMYSGISMVNLRSRLFYFRTSVIFVGSSVTSLTAAFALGVYMVLAPVAYRTAIAICVMSPLVVLYRNVEFWLKLALLARPVCIRMGIIRALGTIATIFVGNMLKKFWPFIFIFMWAAYARGHPVSKMELPVQPSGPLT